MTDELSHLYTKLQKSNTSPELQWDAIKRRTKRIIKQYGRKYVSWQKNTIRFLEKRRNRILRTKPNSATRQQLIIPIDRVLHQLQEELTETQALKAGQFWREQGEKSAGFLKGLHKQRTVQQYMHAIQEPNLDNPTFSGTVHTSLDSKKEIIRQFYTHLYTAENVDPSRLHQFLDSVNPHASVESVDNDELIAPITVEEILAQVNRSPRHSSPGNDGLGYPYLKLLFQIESIQQLIITVFNQALQNAVFPPSWQDIRVRLLPKKGDLQLLKNWRPISLINCDAKVFTRLLNNRLRNITNKIIQPTQAGFMQGRFIGSQGLLLHLVLQKARYEHHTGLGLLLDQEKAYDRVHPQYLEKVLEKYGFSSKFTRCIIQLFFSNKVQVNVNGYYTDDVIQSRGLRQGDPLSPILFNLVLEPLILHIQQDVALTGFQYTVLQEHPRSIKTLAYADDLCVLLNSPDEFWRLQQHLDQYSAVSNALFNKSKTEAFALSGTINTEWTQTLASANITTVYDKHSPTAFRYLGYQLCYTTTQRTQAEQQLIDLVQTQLAIYSRRQLSLRGRVTIMNTLILSKLWYCLRILNPAQSFFTRLKSLVYRYVWANKHPLAAYEQLCLPITQGGLGLIDPQRQHLVLQKKFLEPLFTTTSTDDQTNTNILTTFLLSTLQTIQPSISLATISFFITEFRKHSLIHPTSVINVFYKFVDSHHIQYSLEQVPLTTLLQLPVRHLLLTIPNDHWLHRHPNTLMSDVFTFDENQHRLRLKVPTEFITHPRLSRRVYDDILTRRTVQLQPFVWQYILHDHTLDNTALATTFHHQLITHPQWSILRSTELRNFQDDIGKKYQLLVPASQLYKFWASPMLLPARQLWYRTLIRKLPTGKYLHDIHRRDSPLCSICHREIDTYEHFILQCSKKIEIWQDMLLEFYPHLSLQLEELRHFLVYLQPPVFLSVHHIPTFLTFCSTVQFIIWKHYWKLQFDSTPFSTQNIILEIRQQLQILLPYN